MTDVEIALVNRILDMRPDPVRVFEWGSGQSTVYFPSRIHMRGRSYEWYSAEWDPDWFRRVAMVIKRRNLDVRLSLIERWNSPGSPFRDRPEWARAYADLPARTGGSFDLVINDGKARDECIDPGLRCLGEDGIYLFFDAERPHYKIHNLAVANSMLIRSGVFRRRGIRKSKKLWIAARNESTFDSMVKKVLEPLAFGKNWEFGPVEDVEEPTPVTGGQGLA